MQLKLLGREPTLAIGLVASVLSVLVGFNLDWPTATQAALVVVLNAALGAVNALAVRPIAPAAVTYLVGAVAAYGLDVSQEMVGAINGLAPTGVLSPHPSSPQAAGWGAV